MEPQGWSWPGPASSVGPALHVLSNGTNVEIWSFLLHGMATRDLFPGCFLYGPSRRLTSDEKRGRTCKRCGFQKRFREMVCVCHFSASWLRLSAELFCGLAFWVGVYAGVPAGSNSLEFYSSFSTGQGNHRENSPFLCPLDASRGNDYYDRNLALFEVSKEPFRCGRLAGTSPDLSAKHQASFSSSPIYPPFFAAIHAVVLMALSIHLAFPNPLATLSPFSRAVGLCLPCSPSPR